MSAARSGATRPPVAPPAPSVQTEAGFSLSRWARVKQARAAGLEPTPIVPPVKAAAVGATPAAPAEPIAPLPSIESLTPESDFTGFFQAKVPEVLRNQALRKLFQAPNFNEMDGLDIYVGDYTQNEAVTQEWIESLDQFKRSTAPKPTRINAQGWVEDIPPEEIEATRALLAEAEAQRAARIAADTPSDAPSGTSAPVEAEIPEIAGKDTALAQLETPPPPSGVEAALQSTAGTPATPETRIS